MGSATRKLFFHKLNALLRANTVVVLSSSMNVTGAAFVYQERYNQVAPLLARKFLRVVKDIGLAISSEVVSTKVPGRIGRPCFDT
jgi:hypothetical protein